MQCQVAIPSLHVKRDWSPSRSGSLSRTFRFFFCATNFTMTTTVSAANLGGVADARLGHEADAIGTTAEHRGGIWHDIARRTPTATTPSTSIAALRLRTITTGPIDLARLRSISGQIMPALRSLAIYSSAERSQMNRPYLTTHRPMPTWPSPRKNQMMIRSMTR
jgi:hypothetical protein